MNTYIHAVAFYSALDRVHERIWHPQPWGLVTRGGEKKKKEHHKNQSLLIKNKGGIQLLVKNIKTDKFSI